MAQSWVRVAVVVVSEMKEKLSTKNVRPTIAPVMSAALIATEMPMESGKRQELELMKHTMKNTTTGLILSAV